MSFSRAVGRPGKPVGKPAIGPADDGVPKSQDGGRDGVARWQGHPPAPYTPTNPRLFSPSLEDKPL
jgi:hypothetical protein